MFVVIFFKTMYNETIIRFGFCAILNNQGLGKCYQPRPSVRLITLTSTSIIPDITKTSSNDCLLSPQQSCPEPCWKLVLNRLNILAILHIANTLWLLPTPPSPTPKKENKKVHKHCFCLAWDVRLSYCDTEDNFLLFFRWLMNYGQRQSGEFSLPKPRALWLLIARGFSEFVSHAQ